MDVDSLTDEQKQELQEKLKNMSPEEIAALQKQQCIFCQIHEGKIPSKKVYEDDLCFAIIDINPAAKGHLLLIPKEHYAIMPQLPQKTLEHMGLVSKFLSQLLLREFKATGTNIFVANGLAAGQRAQHFMIHIIPRKDGDGLLAAQNKIVDKEMVAKVKAAIADKLNELLAVASVGVEEKKPVEISATHLPVEKEEEQEWEAEREENKNQNQDESGDPEDDLLSMLGGDEEQDDEEDNDEDQEEEPEDQDEETEDEDDQEETKGDVSLDDIANLFK